MHCSHMNYPFPAFESQQTIRNAALSAQKFSAFINNQHEQEHHNNNHVCTFTCTMDMGGNALISSSASFYVLLWAPLHHRWTRQQVSAVVICLQPFGELRSETLLCIELQTKRLYFSRSRSLSVSVLISPVPSSKLLLAFERRYNPALLYSSMAVLQQRIACGRTNPKHTNRNHSMPRYACIEKCSFTLAVQMVLSRLNRDSSYTILTKQYSVQAFIALLDVE